VEHESNHSFLSSSNVKNAVNNMFRFGHIKGDF
jgi:hypothetical protein